MQLTTEPRPPIALFGTRFGAGEHFLFFHSRRRRTDLRDPVVITLSDSAVPVAYPWAYLQGRELRRVDLDGCSLLDRCPDVEGIDVVLVDDGLLDVDTLAAAAAWIRRGHAKCLVIAVAVADHRLHEAVGSLANEVLVGASVYELAPGANAFLEPVPTRAEADAWIADVQNDRGFDDEEVAVKRPRRLHRSGRLWTEDDDLLLLARFDDQALVSEIADDLARTESAIEGRLRQLGLVDPGTFREDTRFVQALERGKVLARTWKPRAQVRALRMLLQRRGLDDVLLQLPELEAGLRPDPGAASAHFEPCPEIRVHAVATALGHGREDSLDAFLTQHPHLVEDAP